jgi:hypothetical protein
MFFLWVLILVFKISESGNYILSGFGLKNDKKNQFIKPHHTWQRLEVWKQENIAYPKNAWKGREEKPVSGFKGGQCIMGLLFHAKEIGLYPVSIMAPLKYFK